MKTSTFKTILHLGLACCLALSCRGKPEPGHGESTDAGQPRSTEKEAGQSRSTEVEIKAEAGSLYGTLLLPEGKGPFPGVVIIAGSGPTDRDGNNTLLKGLVNNLKELALHLAGRGIASLRYDKRGAGKTPAGDGAIDAAVLTGDAKAAFNFLAAAPEIDKEEVALIGHSEGGLVAILAAKDLRADALVLVSSSGRPLLTLMEEQLGATFKKTLKEDQVEAAEAYLADYLKQLAGTGEIALGPMPEFFTDDLRFFFGELAKPKKVAVIRSLYTIDPAEKLVNFMGPILIIHGEGDSQVPLDDPKRLEAKLAEAGRKNYTMKIIPAMDHMFKQLSGDKPEPYDGPGRKISTEFLDGLSQWIEEVFSIGASNKPGASPVTST